MLAYLAVLLLAAGQFAQSSAGELRITVRDSADLSGLCGAQSEDCRCLDRRRHGRDPLDRRGFL